MQICTTTWKLFTIFVYQIFTTTAAPKIFFRYYYVNSSTGEKSGTILAECKWAPAAAGGEP